GAMRWFWHPVMYASELTDAPRGAVLLGEPVVLVRLAGEVRCFADLCVHRGTALSLGWVEDGELRCAYHGWAYGPDGVCTKIPARFGDSIPRRAPPRGSPAAGALPGGRGQRADLGLPGGTPVPGARVSPARRPVLSRHRGSFLRLGDRRGPPDRELRGLRSLRLGARWCPG